MTQDEFDRKRDDVTTPTDLRPPDPRSFALICGRIDPTVTVSWPAPAPRNTRSRLSQT